MAQTFKAERYVTTSEKTTILGEGLRLNIRLMHTRKDSPEWKQREKEWHDWCYAYPSSYVAAVIKLQDTVWGVASTL